jgi:predicted Zn-dependent protease
MPDPAKRLAYLEKLTREGSRDPFHWYALAQEYKGASRWDEALQTFTTLRTQSPDYVPAYLICGQMLADQGRVDEARDWLEAGVTAATAKKDMHALSEIQGVLSSLPAS